MLAGVLMSGTHPNIGRQSPGALEACRITELGDENGGGVVTDAGDGGQQLADLVLFQLAGAERLCLLSSWGGCPQGPQPLGWDRI